MDGLMMDWLYDELDPSSSAKVAQHVDGCSRCSTEMASLRRTRDAFRGMSHLEPPPAISAILLHEAARRAPGAMAEGAARHSPFWERVRAWLRPIGHHPALAAMASLLLVAGVAGALYVRRGWDIGAPHPLPDTAPVAAPATPPASPEQTVFDDQGEREKGGAAGTVAGADEEQNARHAAGPRSTQSQSPAPDPAKPAPADRGDGYAAGLLDGDKEADLRQATEYAQAPPKSRARKQAPPPKVAERRAKNDAKKAIAARDRSEPAEGEVNRRGIDPAAADVVTSDGTGSRPARNEVGRAAPAEPVAPGGAAVATGKPDSDAASTTRALSKQEEGWLTVQQQKLTALARGKRCREAAAIANDILDRNAEYYVRRIRDSKDVEPCRRYVGVETKRRAAGRARARAGNKAAGASQKAKAAPARDEAAAEQSAD